MRLLSCPTLPKIELISSRVFPREQTLATFCHMPARNCGNRQTAPANVCGSFPNLARKHVHVLMRERSDYNAGPGDFRGKRRV
jgi:hypothetical protein